VAVHRCLVVCRLELGVVQGRSLGAYHIFFTHLLSFAVLVGRTMIVIYGVYVMIRSIGGALPLHCRLLPENHLSRESVLSISPVSELSGVAGIVKLWTCGHVHTLTPQSSPSRYLKAIASRPLSRTFFAFARPADRHSPANYTVTNIPTPPRTGLPFNLFTKSSTFPTMRYTDRSTYGIYEE
jgi:hypothetical protein